MNMRQISTMTEDELVKAFRNLALRQQAAYHAFDSATFNKIYKQMSALAMELRTRAGDGRRFLLPLLEDGNIWVRFKAGVNTLTIAPAESRAAIATVAEQTYDSDARAHALGTLDALEKGTFPFKHERPVAPPGGRRKLD